MLASILRLHVSEMSEYYCIRKASRIAEKGLPGLHGDTDC